MAVNENSAAVAAFLQEAREQLEELEELLLSLEGDPSPDRVDAVFRTLHTVKGSGAMFGFDALARFAHHFEEAFDRVRSGSLAVNRRLIDLALQARDHMKALLESRDPARTAELAAAPEAAALVAALSEITGGDSGDVPPPAADAAEPSAPAGGTTCFEIEFRPSRDAFRTGMKPELLVAEVAELGEASVVVDTGAVPPLDTLDPKLCDLAWHIRLRTAKPRHAVEAVFMFAEDGEVSIREEGEPPAAQRSREPAPVTAPVRAPEEPAAERRRASDRGDSVRVPSVRLDDMMDQIGELVITQSRLQQISAQLGDGTLESVVEELERLVGGLRDAVLSVRMLPIEVVFGRFRRLVRDLSQELGKDVALVAEGGETQIDKNVIDRLGEPLVHMIRNAVDHGLEDAAGRLARGKPARGTVRLRARQEGGEVLISIQDDGAGLDAEAIRRKAVERGLLAADATPSAHEIHQLIFLPGFSTAASVSSVSGRGVGMDAVQSAITALRGQIEVDSEPGQGTRVTLRLPLTLAIIDGLLVRLGRAVFVIPLAAVEECVELSEHRPRGSGNRMMQLREHLVPILPLDEVFGQPAGDEQRRRVVIVRAGGGLIGLVVDDILGQRQTVIKTLSPYHRNLPGFAGATILGDGTVALIIEVGTLTRRVATELRSAHRLTAA